MAVSFEQFQKLRSQGLSNEQIRKFDSGYVPQNVPQETPKNPGMISRFLTSAKEALPKLGGEIIQRGKNAFSALSRGKEYDSSKGIVGNAVEGALTPLHIAGQAAGAVGNVIGAGAEIAYRTAVPEPTQQKIKGHVLDILDTPAGQAGLQVLKQGGDVYQKFKEANPETARSLEDVLNIATVIPGVKLAGKGVKEVKNLASDTLDVATRLKGGSEEAVNKIIDTGIEKGIRPSVVGKQTAQQMDAFKQNARTAVLAITKNKKALSFSNDVGEVLKGVVPKSLKEFSESVEQTKKTIFKKYDSLAKKAGEAGGQVNLSSVAEELKKVGADKVLNDLYPEVVSYARKRAESLAKRATYSTEEAQTAIKHLNESLQAFYRNPTFESASKAQIDAMVANNIRTSLDNVITNATGEGYSALKKVYGALKSIEKDVSHRAIVDARKNVKGLIDFTDIFSAGDILSGIATMNPAQIAKGGVQKAIATIYKKLNDPNRIIKRMFQGAEKYLQRKESSFAPKSMTGKGIVALKGKGGMSIQDVSGGKAGYSNTLLQEAGKYTAEQRNIIEPFKEGVTMYHAGGKGGGLQLSRPEAGNALGEGNYYANLSQASRYGRNIEEKVVKLDNPLLIQTDQDLRNISNTTSLYRENPAEQKALIESVKKKIVDAGHDGVIIKMKSYQDSQYLQKLFGHDQVIDYKSPLYNKAQGGVTQSPLLQEAGSGKYKSAEEFVKSKKSYYHGTASDFKNFDFGSGPRSSAFGSKDVKGNAIFFTEDPKTAKVFADNRAEYLQYEKGITGTPRVIESKLNISKPADFTTPEKADAIFEKAGLSADELLGGYGDMGRSVSDLIDSGDAELKDIFRIFDNKEAVAKLKAAGYDGAVLQEGKNLGNSYAVFDPKQIQSKSQLTDLWNKAQGGTKRGFGTGAGRTAGASKATLKEEVSKTLDNHLSNLKPSIEGGVMNFKESTALNDLNSLKKDLSKATTMESIRSIQQEAKTIVDKVLNGRSDKLAPVIKNETKMNIAIEKAKKFKFFDEFSKAYPNTPTETLKKIFLSSRK